MKKKIVCGVVLFTGFLASCKKEYSLEGSVNLAANFTAQIDGAQWAAAENNESATISQGLINITGVSLGDQQISITLADSTVGSYTLSQSSLSLASYSITDSSALYAFSTNQGIDTAEAGGYVTVTSIDAVHKTLTGTFSFNVFRNLDGTQHEITMGVFNAIPYTTGTGVSGASASDTLQATIGGSAWTGQNTEAAVTAGELSIIGSSANNTQTIGLEMPSNVTPGAYPLDGSNPAYVGLYTVVANSTTEGLVSNQGTLTVLENNQAQSRITGSFQFTALDPNDVGVTATITKGYFSVYYGQ
jgi:hypothetical protein